MKILIALGGNALIQRGQPLEQEVQIENIKKGAKVIEKMARDNKFVICHGNGPQIGLLSLLANSYEEVKPYTLDVLVAESQGMIGYLLQQALFNEGLESVVTLLTQVIVDENDPSFLSPSKPIGPVYDKKTALQLAKEQNWDVAPDGEYYRRVVPSPLPKEIVEIDAAKDLMHKGYVVIFCGGGGIPVLETKHSLIGKEGVIDKDRVSALAAEKLEMDVFLILTDVEAVYKDWNTPKQKMIKEISPIQIRKMDFAKGSMKPKIEAASVFVEQTGKPAAIGSLFEMEAILEGESGTWIKKDTKEITYY